ncbi:MAG: family 10 glycosylhydrolase, partial [Bacteroidales bacterium]
MKNNITLFICLLISVACFAQSPKREQRATWVATVFRIDWPSTVISSPGNSSDIKLQKKRLVEILDSLSSGNMNAIYFQIRSQCDAIYNSAYEPWSSDFVATRGMDPGYDPFEFLIEEGHKRGIEVHAWLNPYRFESAAGKWEGQIGDYRKSNPDWVLEVKNQTILNPGIPEVRQRITDIVEDILLKYDLDGIMFDDYFYLSGISDEDKKEQIKYNTTGLSVEDWRRQNVNKMIAQVYHKIQDLKPFVKFGVGPAGIWGGPKSAADAYGVTNPAGIGSGFAYNKIFCDPLAWLHEKTIDYISPQIYWTIGSAGTDYDILSKWWSEVSNKFNRNFYSSHSLSAMDPKPAPGRRFTVNGISVE